MQRLLYGQLCGSSWTMLPLISINSFSFHPQIFKFRALSVHIHLLVYCLLNEGTKEEIIQFLKDWIDCLISSFLFSCWFPDESWESYVEGGRKLSLWVTEIRNIHNGLLDEWKINGMTPLSVGGQSVTVASVT